MQKSNAKLTSRRRHTSPSSRTSNASYQRQPKNNSRPEISPARSDFDDNLLRFSLVPVWLQLVDDELLRTPEWEYPFPQTSARSPTLSNSTSKPSSPLQAPLCFHTPPPNSPSGTVSSSEDDRRYWDEEVVLFDGEEQNEDLEVVYKSFRY
jgi:hypothetical protein